MLHAPKFSAPFVQRQISVLLVCAALVSSPYALSAVSPQPVFSAASTQAMQSPVTSDGTNAYFEIAYTGKPRWVRIYLDTDRNAATGYTVYGIGASHMIENGRLYRYSGRNSEWAWTYVKTLPFSSGNGLATLTLARADIASPTAINVVTQTDAPLQVSPVIPHAFDTTTPRPAGPVVEVNYAASAATIANPERGFYRQFGCGTPLSQI